ncbi:DUF2341 domain-containing protein [Lewinella cohaerens]|uniref:DUF2341 domain-containing protein n=1 Tax=Lewinella cohaerens TaxID=70995 RepID=UPI003CCBE7F7
MRADGADLRVYTTDCTLLPFWADSLGLNTATQVWVKIPSIAAGASMDVQVYYGKADATSAADGDNTFLFFDDFEGAEVDANKWEAVGEYATFGVNDGFLQYASTAMNPGPRFKFARSKATFSEQVIFDFVIERTNADGFGFSSSEEDLSRFLIRDSGFGFDTLNQIAVMLDTTSNGSASQNTYPILRFDRFAFNTVSITPHINDDNQFVITRFANEGLGDENLDTFTVNNINMPGFHFIVSSFSNTFIIEMDNIRVRQHTATPPVSTNGAEIFLDPSNLTSLIDPSRVQVFPNPATEQSQISIDYQEPVSVQVFNAQGQQFSNLNIRLNPGQSASLATSQLPAGLYLLQFNRLSDGALLHTHSLSVVK